MVNNVEILCNIPKLNKLNTVERGMIFRWDKFSGEGNNNHYCILCRVCEKVEIFPDLMVSNPLLFMSLKDGNTIDLKNVDGWTIERVERELQYTYIGKCAIGLCPIENSEREDNLF